MKNNMNKRVMVITGASRGLGRLLCTYFAKMGLKIVAIARNQKDLESLRDEIEDEGGTIRIYPADVTDYKSTEKIISDVEKKWGSIDVLVNNAGLDKAGMTAPIESLSQEDIDLVIDVNLKGTIYFTKFVIPIMKKNKSGYIINISSMAATKAFNSNGIYHSTKYGINGFGEAMTKYLAEDNIRVVNLCPGGIKTTWWERAEYNRDKKLIVEPPEIAELIKFLLESRSSTLFKNISFFSRSEAEVW